MEQSAHRAINNLSRAQIVALLENHGFACYDTESTDDLREAVRAEAMAGEISPEEIETF